MTDNYNSDTERRRGRKVAAILAGGLVLGVGTMATLASWNDSEFATGTFTAGKFNLEGSTTAAAGSWDDHPASPGAALSFSTPFNNLTPTDVVYASYAVRLAADTTNDANVTISATSSNTVSNLTYQLVKVPSITCDKPAVDLAAATPANILIPAGTAVGSTAGVSAFELTKGTPTSNAGATVFLCFKVTAGTITQGQSGSGTWQFSAVSKV